MFDQKVLFKVMLWSLGVAAVLRLGDGAAGYSPAIGLGKAADFKTLRVECPQCGQFSEMAVGDSTCPYCRLSFRIEVYTNAPDPRLDENNPAPE